MQKSHNCQCHLYTCKRILFNKVMMSFKKSLKVRRYNSSKILDLILQYSEDNDTVKSLNTICKLEQNEQVVNYKLHKHVWLVYYYQGEGKSSMSKLYLSLWPQYGRKLTIGVKFEVNGKKWEQLCLIIQSTSTVQLLILNSII